MSLLDLITDESKTEVLQGKVFGVVVAIVTNNKDPDGLGRVKVRFPWLEEQVESHWARMAFLMGGKDRGTFFLPEVDDEVLVAFEHGDVRFPFIVGALWNGVDTPPYTNSDGKNNIRAIKSRSGHELILSDESGKEKIEIRTQAGHQVLLDDAGGKEKILIVDKSGNNQVEIDTAKNSIAIQGQTKISLKAQTIEIEAGSSLKIKSQMAEIKADSMMTVESSSMLTLKGSLVKIN